MCTTQELINSFPSMGDAFFWFGAATWGELLDREAEIAKTRPTRMAAAAGGCDGCDDCDGEADAAAYLVFDVETDGGSPKQLAIQLAYIVYDTQDREVFRFDKLLRLPPGKKINWHSIKIHKISDNVLALRGVDPTEEMRLFFQWVEWVQAKKGLIIAHNAAFDAAVVTNTAAQNALSYELEAQDCFCTMRAATPHAGLVNKRGAPKPPKNSELYEIFHHAPPDWAVLHNALDDVRVTACNYRGGRDQGWWE